MMWERIVIWEGENGWEVSQTKLGDPKTGLPVPINFQFDLTGDREKEGVLGLGYKGAHQTIPRLIPHSARRVLFQDLLPFN